MGIKSDTDFKGSWLETIGNTSEIMWSIRRVAKRVSHYQEASLYRIKTVNTYIFHQFWV